MKTRLISATLLLSLSVHGMAQVSAPPTAAQPERAQALEKQRDSLVKVSELATSALRALNQSAASLSSTPLLLPTSRSAQEAQEMIAPAGIEESVAALGALTSIPGETLLAVGITPAGLKQCNEAFGQLLRTRKLDTSGINTRMQTENAEAFKMLQESADPQHQVLMRGMLVAGWLAAETETVLGCMPALQKQLSQLVEQNTSQLLKTEDQLLMHSLEAANPPPPEPPSVK